MKKPITDWDKHREQFVRNALRKVSMMWPAGALARRAARTERQVNPMSGRLAWRSRCAACQLELLEGHMELDHKESVVPVRRDYGSNAYGPEQLGALVTRLLPPPEGYQILCPACHAGKTANEQQVRAEARREYKRRTTV